MTPLQEFPLPPGERQGDEKKAGGLNGCPGRSHGLGNPLRNPQGSPPAAVPGDSAQGYRSSSWTRPHGPQFLDRADVIARLQEMRGE